jgi:signal transduction histidine kinase
MVEASGRRQDGEGFFSQAWVSTYNTGSGLSLAVILLDVTEQIRDREETGLKQLLRNSRIIAGAVSHELRNLAAAASVLHHNLSRSPGVGENTDFQALGTVIDSVLKLSSTELSDSSEEILEGLDMTDLLRELRAIIAPSLQQARVELEWEVQKNLPSVRANRPGLLQVFLNLAKNSASALNDRWDGKLRIVAYRLENSVVIRFSDNGPGISSAERLFQPFQPGASSTGLGLFVSRAIVRTFGGELHHTQQPGECCFVVELPAVAQEAKSAY